MTTPSEFKEAVLKSLAHLDTVLPKGSHVAFMPLADGRVLYDTTHTHIHPIGVPYPDVYTYLSCSGLNPCWGWLNTNETWRNFTTARAEELTAQYKVIIKEHSFQNFDMFLLTIEWQDLFKKYIAQGGHVRLQLLLLSIFALSHLCLNPHCIAAI